MSIPLPLRPPLRLFADALDERLPLRVTLVLLLIRPPEDPYVRGGIWLLAAAGLIVPALATRAWLWAGAAVLMLARLAVEFPLADNHLYLLFYWCLAIALALVTPAPGDILARSARWLVAATFTCAVLWKALLAPDFLDGRFFRVTLLTDDRFATAARAVGQLTDAQLTDDREALRPLDGGIEVLDGPVLVEPAPLRALGVGLTWGGALLEALLALAFLAPRRRVPAAARHALLLVFCAVTYAIAPVGGFGWLLAAIGMAQAGGSPRWRAAYAAACVLILVYAETPAVSWLIGLAAP